MDFGVLAANKQYLYKVYDIDDNFLGTWTDVHSELAYSHEINSAGSMFDLILARIDNFGPGTDAALANKVEVYVQYGYYGNWVTDGGDQMVTDNGDTFVFAIGAPNGRKVFTGIITRVVPNYGQNFVTVTLASQGIELNNTVIQNSTIEDYHSDTNSPQGFGNWSSPLNTRRVAQTFSPSVSDTLVSVEIFIIGLAAYATFPETILVDVYAGNDPSVDLIPANLIGSTTKIATSVSQILGNRIYTFSPGLPVSGSQDYIIVVSTTTAFAPGSDNYPFVVITTTNEYPGGSLWVEGNDSPNTIWSDTTTKDMMMSFTYEGGDTTVPYFSQDPSDIVRSILDINRVFGGEIYYASGTIVNTEYVASYTFRLNTVTEGIDKALQLAPSDWYWLLDQGTSLIYFKPRRDTPDFYITKGIEIEHLELEHTLEGLVNEAYFSGGDDGTGENVFIKRNSPASLALWPRFISRESDNRVTLESSAELLTDGVLNRSDAPRYRSTLILSATKFDIERIKGGEVVGFRNFDNYIDDLILQVVGYDYTRDNVTLRIDSLLPKVTKRLADLKRNLDLLDTLNNPDAPS